MVETILIVDDEATQRTLLDGIIKRQGHNTLTAANGAEAIDLIEGPKADSISLVLLDLAMPKASGIDVLNRIRPLRPSLPVIVLTAQASVSKVVDAMRAGANDFLVKPVSAERLRTAITGALSRDSMVGEIESLETGGTSTNRLGDLIGDSPAMKQAQAFAGKAARTTVPILIEGESGVGKEVFARAIHKEGARAEKPFVAVNCGALPENLVESTLFGHEKGAFTGAVDTHIGKFEEANGGTLFLDEIGELPPEAQVKLLRALQEGEIDRVGGRVPIHVDIRLISATNREMGALVATGQFREDLYYRLNVVPLTVPPLRERRSDIPLLAKHFLNEIVRREGATPRGFTQAAMDVLVGYHWPGNIRQLQNAIFRAVILSDCETLDVNDFADLAGHTEHRADSAAAELRRESAVSSGASADAARHHPMQERASISLFGADGHIRSIDEVEADLIRAAIHRYGGHMSEVARRLGIGRSTLYRRLADLNLQPDRQAQRAAK